MNTSQVFAALKTALKGSLPFQLGRGHPTLNLREMAKARLDRLLSPSKLSVGWLLVGDENVGSSRIHGFNLHRYLLGQGVSSHVIHSPAGYIESLDIDELLIESIVRCRFDVVVFQRVHQGRASDLIRRLKAARTRTAFFMADLYETDAFRETDYVFAVSSQLKTALVDRGMDEGRIFVLPDAIETPYTQCKQYDRKVAGAPIRIVWTGANGHWSTLNNVRRLLHSDSRFADYRLTTISLHPETDVTWALATVWDELLRGDIGIVPVDLATAEARVKSNNRVTMFKALGMPVICSRLPVYEEAIIHGETGYFADTEEDWATYLLALCDPEARRRIGLNGRHEIFRKYGIDTIGSAFLRLLLRHTGGLRSQEAAMNTTDKRYSAERNRT